MSKGNPLKFSLEQEASKKKSIHFNSIKASLRHREKTFQELRNGCLRLKLLSVGLRRESWKTNTEYSMNIGKTGDTLPLLLST